jgi:hypothetical protein
MRSGVGGFQAKLDAAKAILDRAQRAGMEVSQPVYQLAEARNHLVLARVQIHGFNPAFLLKTVGEGESISAACEQSGRRALADLAYRRKGLAVSAVILLCMIGLLLLKIRQLKA